MPGMVMPNGFDEMYQRLAKLERIVSSYEGYKGVLFGSEQECPGEQHRTRLPRIWQEIQSGGVIGGGDLPDCGGYNKLNGIPAPGGMPSVHPMYMPQMVGIANSQQGYGTMMPDRYSNVMRDRIPMWNERYRGCHDVYHDGNEHIGDGE